MSVDLPPIPPAVVEFAEKNDIQHIQKDSHFSIKKHNSKLQNVSEAYFGNSPKSPLFEEKENYFYSHYAFILVEKGRVHLATPEETEQLNRILFL